MDSYSNAVVKSYVDWKSNLVLAALLVTPRQKITIAAWPKTHWKNWPHVVSKIRSSLKGRLHWKRWFRDGVYQAKVKEFRPWHMPNFEEFGFKVVWRLVPLLFGYINIHSMPFKTPVLDRSYEYPIKEGPNLKPPPGIRHILSSFLLLPYQTPLWNRRLQTCVAYTSVIS